MDTFWNAALLKVARQLRGFGQGEASERLGIAQARLSRVENGVTPMSAELAERAATAFSIPMDFFRQTDAVYGPPVSVHPLFRKKADVTRQQLDRIVAEINVFVMHLRRLLDAAQIRPEFELPRLDIDDFEGDAERIAALVRAHWLLPSGPITNLTDTLERAGCVILHSNLAHSEVMGVTFAIPGFSPLIILNRNQPADRMRFTLAHELGHLVMHRLPTAAMEQEANEFASAFLLPRAEIRQSLQMRVDMPRLAALKLEWRVSMQAILYRAQKIGAVDPGRARYMWQQFAQSGMRTREPPQTEFPHEAPTVVERLVKLHSQDLGFGIEGLARLLCISEEDLAEMYPFAVGKAARPRLRVVH